MKKIFTLVTAAMAILGANAQDSKPIGLSRPIDLENGVLGDVEINAPFGVSVTEIRGENTKTREEQEVEGAASDLFIGYSIKEDETPDMNKAAFALVGENVFYPKVAEQTERQADEFFGFHLNIPESNPITIDALDVYLLSGNAYMWQVEITNAAGEVVYKTQDKGIKINNYNKTAYTNAIKVSSDAVTEPAWSVAILKAWGAAENNDVKETQVLPELKDITGEYDVKVYYWGKWQKNLTYANIYLYATGTEAAGSSNAAGIYRPMDLENGVVGDIAIAQTLGVTVSEIRGANTKTREEQEVEGAATDLYIGYSIKEGETPDMNKAAFALVGENVFYPKVAEQTARQEDEFFGYTIQIPEGKYVNIDSLDVYLLAGNAYMWQVEITDAEGKVLYKTQDKGIKINNYNKTAYTNAIKVSADAVTEPAWSVAILKAWGAAENNDVAETEKLGDAVKGLSGTISVKVYYWGKWQKNLTFANVLTYLSEGEASSIAAIQSAPAKDNIMYNILGQRVTNAKGIVIMNGRKMIIK